MNIAPLTLSAIAENSEPNKGGVILANLHESDIGGSGEEISPTGTLAYRMPRGDNTDPDCLNKPNAQSIVESSGTKVNPPPKLVQPALSFVSEAHRVIVPEGQLIGPQKRKRAKKSKDVTKYVQMNLVTLTSTDRIVKKAGRPSKFSKL